MTIPSDISHSHRRITSQLMTWLRAPRLEANADFHAAKEWARQYSPTGREENGEVVLQFSKDQYALVSGMLGELDKKADDLMRTTLAVFGAVLAAVSAHVVQISFPWTWFALAGLILLGLGVAVAAMARIPAELTTPMTPRELIQVSDFSLLPSKSQVQSAAAASYHFATVGATILNKWKTTQLRRANWFFLVGLFLLSLSLPGNSWTLGQFRPSQEAKSPPWVDSPRQVQPPTQRDRGSGVPRGIGTVTGS